MKINEIIKKMLETRTMPSSRENISNTTRAIELSLVISDTSLKAKCDQLYLCFDDLRCCFLDFCYTGLSIVFQEYSSNKLHSMTENLPY